MLTLDNIIAVNPETGEFKVKDTERIDSKAYPIPTQYVILFYSNGSFLFDAKLNSSISSYLPKGLTFCHFLSDKNGLARYDLGATRIVSADREVIEGKGLRVIEVRRFLARNTALGRFGGFGEKHYLCSVLVTDDFNLCFTLIS